MNYLLIFISALLLAVGGTPIARRLALRLDVLDLPSERKIHSQPIPRLGGVAIYTAFMLALVLLGNRFYISQVVGIFLGATLVSLLGAWDDRRGLPAYLKLVGQILAALILIGSGVEVGFLHHPVLNALVTVIWVVGITNALNFLDNMDGLAGGVATIASTFFVLMAGLSGQYLVGSLAAAVMGASLGFLLYNFNPATIFMGDSGALFLGFVLAAVGIKLRFPDNVDFVTWMVPVAVLALPIFDMALVVLSRLRRGKNPLTTPGKDHVSHRLVTLGYTRREAVLILYLACGAGGVLAMAITEASVVMGYVLGGIAFIGGLVALAWLEWRVPGGQLRITRETAQPSETK